MTGLEGCAHSHVANEQQRCGDPSGPVLSPGLLPRDLHPLDGRDFVGGVLESPGRVSLHTGSGVNSLHPPLAPSGTPQTSVGLKRTCSENVPEGPTARPRKLPAPTAGRGRGRRHAHRRSAARANALRNGSSGGS